MNSCLHTWAIAYGGNGRWVYDPLDNLREADQGARQFRYFYNDTGPSPTWRLASIKNPGGTTLNSFAYDVRGNTLQRNAGDAFTFDRANRLLTATLGASSYRYDALGRRAQQIAGGLTTRYQYSRAGQLLQLDESSPARHHTYIYLSGSLVAKRTVPASGPVQVRYQHTDGLGSLVAASDESAVVVRRERMTAYGEPADGGWANGHGYTGHQNDAATELVYMQQRYYDPAIGRFLSVDPLAANSSTGSNFQRYWYADNNPFRYVDPDGRSSTDKWFGFNDPDFRDYVHGLKAEEGRRPDENYTKDDLRKLERQWIQEGSPRGKGGKSGRGGKRRAGGWFRPTSALKVNIFGIVVAIAFHVGDAGDPDEDRRTRERHDEMMRELQRVEKAKVEVGPTVPDQPHPDEPNPDEPSPEPLNPSQPEPKPGTLLRS